MRENIILLKIENIHFAILFAKLSSTLNPIFWKSIYRLGSLQKLKVSSM
ncbi:17596_t:CDS:2 [Dentiscutata erythropus]|uniref:17596_t:CDS:1 n=1 Tax=Dentiscutata erythropus TaxID=1348616 RepID=A0A9N9GRS2_9GLOM|nr:17596_t:CDS:2 [Dentiscutata erythropus]